MRAHATATYAWQPTQYATIASTRRATTTTTKTATATASPPKTKTIVYHGTNDTAYSSLQDGIHLPTWDETVWGAGEFGRGFYTTVDLKSAIPWAYDTAQKKGGDAIVVAVEVTDMQNMTSLSISTTAMFDLAKDGAFDSGYDYLIGPVVGSPQRGTQIKFNVESFGQLKVVGIVWVATP